MRLPRDLMPTAVHRFMLNSGTNHKVLLDSRFSSAALLNFLISHQITYLLTSCCRILCGNPSYSASEVVKCGGGDVSGEFGGDPEGDSTRFSSTHFLSADGFDRGFRWIFLLAAEMIEDTMSRVDTSLPERTWLRSVMWGEKLMN